MTQTTEDITQKKVYSWKKHYIYTSLIFILIFFVLYGFSRFLYLIFPSDKITIMLWASGVVLGGITPTIHRKVRSRI